MKTLVINSCKHCGLRPEIKAEGLRTVIECRTCGVSVGNENELVSAIDDWNVLNTSINNIRNAMLIQQHKGNPNAGFLMDRLPEPGEVRKP